MITNTSWLLRLCCLLLLAPAVAAGGGVGGESGLSPNEGNLGTLLTIDAAPLELSFGDEPGKVLLLDNFGKKRSTLVIESWSDTLITARVKKGRFGTYTVSVRRKKEKEPVVSFVASFALVPFAPTGELPVVGMPDVEVLVEGLHLGDRKGSVKVNGKRAKVTRWEPGGGGGGDPGPVSDLLGFVVPKTLTDNLYDLTIKTPAGTATLELPLEVIDSPHVDLRNEMRAELNGKPWKQRGARAVRIFVPNSDCVGEGDGAPADTCTILGGVKGKTHVLALAIPAYYAPTDGPVTCEPASCLVEYQKGKSLWAGFADVTLWKATPGGQISGSFSGTMTRVLGTKGPETIEVTEGRLYDID